MGRGRSTGTASASSALTNPVKTPVKGPLSAEKGQPPPDDSDESSPDSSGRKTRRSLQTVPKEHNVNAIMPSKSESPSNKRSRPRQNCPQINHNLSSNLTDSNNTQKIFNFNSSTDELLVVSDGIPMKNSSSSYNHALNMNGISPEEIVQVADDFNVINVIEISDETDNLSCDTDTATTGSSSVIPDSNDTTCSADDEAESSISDESRVRSSSIITVADDDSRTMNVVVEKNCSNVKGKSCENVIGNALPTSPQACNSRESSKSTLTPEENSSNKTSSLTVDPAAMSGEADSYNRTLSSPEFLNVPKQKIVRTYQNKRKFRADAVKCQEESLQSISEQIVVQKTEAEQPSLERKDTTKTEKSPATDRLEVPECRRSQRQRVIKYEVRDLFQRKGNRNQSDSKNSRSSNASYKAARGSPRSDLSSSPQTFKGFSDAEDPSSPINSRKSMFRPANTSPSIISKDVTGSEKSSALKSFPDSHEVIIVEDELVIQISDSQSPTLEATAKKVIKVTKSPLKKEPQKPSRILPRRKTVLLNRSTDDPPADSETYEKSLENKVDSSLTPKKQTKLPRSKSMTPDRKDSKNVDELYSEHGANIVKELEQATESKTYSNISVSNNDDQSVDDSVEDQLSNLFADTRSLSIQCELVKRDDIISPETMSDGTSHDLPTTPNTRNIFGDTSSEKDSDLSEILSPERTKVPQTLDRIENSPSDIAHFELQAHISPIAPRAKKLQESSPEVHDAQEKQTCQEHISNSVQLLKSEEKLVEIDSRNEENRQTCRADTLHIMSSSDTSSSDTPDKSSQSTKEVNVDNSEAILDKELSQNHQDLNTYCQERFTTENKEPSKSPPKKKISITPEIVVARQVESSENIVADKNKLVKNIESSKTGANSETKCISGQSKVAAAFGQVPGQPLVRKRGRPPGSKNKPKPPASGDEIKKFKTKTKSIKNSGNQSKVVQNKSTDSERTSLGKAENIQENKDKCLLKIPTEDGVLPELKTNSKQKSPEKSKKPKKLKEVERNSEKSEEAANSLDLKAANENLPTAIDSSLTKQTDRSACTSFEEINMFESEKKKNSLKSYEEKKKTGYSTQSNISKSKHDKSRKSSSSSHSTSEERKKEKKRSINAQHEKSRDSIVLSNALKPGQSANTSTTVESDSFKEKLESNKAKSDTYDANIGTKEKSISKITTKFDDPKTAAAKQMESSNRVNKEDAKHAANKLVEKDKRHDRKDSVRAEKEESSGARIHEPLCVKSKKYICGKSEKRSKKSYENSGETEKVQLDRDRNNAPIKHRKRLDSVDSGKTAKSSSRDTIAVQDRAKYGENKKFCAESTTKDVERKMMSGSKTIDNYNANKQYELTAGLERRKDFSTSAKKSNLAKFNKKIDQDDAKSRDANRLDINFKKQNANIVQLDSSNSFSESLKKCLDVKSLSKPDSYKISTNIKNRRLSFTKELKLQTSSKVSKELEDIKTVQPPKIRYLSKALSTSDGISDAYSSDSSESKVRLSTEDVKSAQNESCDDNSLRTAPNFDSGLKEEQQDELLASNLSSVLNGLSKASMNDLLEWTCNNKQTVMQIKDTIDQSQKINLKSEDDSTEACLSSTNIPCVTEETKTEVIVNEHKVSEIAASQAQSSLESISQADVSALGDSMIKSEEETETISSVIQTSKEMLAELMSSSFDDEIYPCPEADRKKAYDSDQTDQNSQDDTTSIRRRSDRIKTQTKSIVGRGLVRDRSDRNQNSAIALNLEAQNAKFLKDMEERLSQFQMIKENEYKCERVITREAKRMTCDCFLTRDEEERGELGCGEDCLNRLLMIECSSTCNVGDRCTNRRFQYNQYAPCKVFRTEKKGFGIMADAEIESGEFIMEYVGEVLNGKQFEKRAAVYSEDKNKHYYFMALRGDSIIDATMKGNISRFINHSCDPNAETQKWTVNGELRIGFFSKRKISPGEEITFDYQFQRYGKEAQKCYCESATCRGWIGEEPDTEEEEDELTSSESEDEAEVKSPDEDLIADKDRIVQPKVHESQQPHTSLLDLDKQQEVAISDSTTITPSNERLISMTPADKKAEREKQKFARRAQKAAEKFAKIAAKLKAKKEREQLKQSNLTIEDRDIEAQIASLEKIGLKNQPLTLQLNRCMVRVKSLQSKERLLNILKKGEMACRRLFLDYHGLRLLHGWMSEIETTDVKLDLQFRHQILVTLDVLPIPNKTILKDSKVFQVVDNWYIEMNRSLMTECLSDNDDDNSQSPPSKKLKTNEDEHQALRKNIRDFCDKLTSGWEILPEVFRIPKRERIEQMKEHEREADRQYKALNLGDEDQYHNQLRNKERFGAKKCSFKWVRDKYEKRKDSLVKEVVLKSAEAKLTKLQRRQLFAAKVAKDEAEKRLAEERREFEFKCKFYGLDPRFVTPNNMPFYVHPSTGQWYSKEKKEIPTPPSHAHIKVPPKPQSSDPKDYNMPEMDLPPMWKYAMDPRGRLYYYHIKIRIPQWEPPIKILPLTNDAASDAASLTEDPTSSQPSTSACMNEPQPGTSKQALSAAASETTCTDTDETDSDISCSEIIGIKKGVPLKIGKEMIDELKRSRKRKRFNRLVQERTISPRREEDRLYNQIEMRRYRENKEKIRRRKEEIKRRKAQMKKETENEPVASTSAQPSTSSPQISGDNLSIPIQDYLLSSDEDELENPEYDNSLIEKIVHGDKIVDELDAIAKEKPLKRALPILKDHSESKKRVKLDDKNQSESVKSVSVSDKPVKSRKTESASSKNTKRAREKFRSDIAGIIVHHLTPYRRDSCSVGRITTNEDFKHLARKLTHFVLLKELKHCDTTGQVLIVTESVKNKSREFIKKYMAKYGDVYVRPANDPEFRDIPH